MNNKKAPTAIGAEPYYTKQYYQKSDKKSTERSFYNGVCVGIVICGVTILFILHYVAGII